MAVQAATHAVTVAVIVVTGRSFQLDATVANVTSASAAVLLMGLDFGLGRDDSRGADRQRHQDQDAR